MQTFIPILKFIFDFMAYASLGLFLFTVIKTEQDKRKVTRSLEKQELTQADIESIISVLKAIEDLKEDEKH